MSYNSLFFILASAGASEANSLVPVYVVSSAVIFIFVWQVLNRVFFKPVLAVLYEREARTSGDEARAHHLKDETKKIVHGLESELRVVRVEGLKQRDELVNIANDKANALIEEAQARAQSELVKARKHIAELKEQARSELQTEAEKLAQETFLKLMSEAGGY